MFEIIKSGGGKIENENVEGIIKKVYASKRLKEINYLNNQFDML
nr:hypothetical protein [Mycoplasmopsis bovis]